MNPQLQRQAPLQSTRISGSGLQPQQAYNQQQPQIGVTQYNLHALANPVTRQQIPGYMPAYNPKDFQTTSQQIRQQLSRPVGAPTPIQQGTPAFQPAAQGSVRQLNGSQPNLYHRLLSLL